MPHRTVIASLIPSTRRAIRARRVTLPNVMGRPDSLQVTCAISDRAWSHAAIKTITVTFRNNPSCPARPIRWIVEQPSLSRGHFSFLGCVLIRAGELRSPRASSGPRDFSLSLSLSLSRYPNIIEMAQRLPARCSMFLLVGYSILYAQHAAIFVEVDWCLMGFDGRANLE